MDQSLLSDAETALIRASLQPDNALQNWLRYCAIRTEDKIDEGEVRLFPLVQRNLPSHDASLPKIDLLRAAVQWAKIRKVTSDRTVLRLRDIGQELRIPFLLTKGTALADRIYAPQDLRASMDVDVISHWHNVIRLREYVMLKGWEILVDIHHDDSPDPKLTSTEFSFSVPGLSNVDVSWAPRLPFVHDDTMIRELWRSRPPGQIIDYASPTWLLIETIEHGLSSNSVSPIRWIVDGATIINKQAQKIDWRLVIDVAKRYKLTHTLLTGLTQIFVFTADFETRVIERLEAIPLVRGEVFELQQRLRVADITENYFRYRASNLLLRSDDKDFSKLADLFSARLKSTSKLAQRMQKRSNSLK